MEHAFVKHDIALVVPVLGDAEALAELIGQVDGWHDRPAEIIVVSGRPDPRLAGLCRDRGCRLIDAQANRGAQLDRGARQAQARALWFLHADVRLPDDGLQAIDAALAAGAEGGCFRFGFQGSRTWYKRLLERLVALRIALGGIPYGDQGIFVRRDVYLECGGFPQQPLFEEVRLVRRLRRRGRFRPLAARVRVSTRCWERDGWWSRSWRNRWLASCNMLGVSPEKLAGAYRGGAAAGSDHVRGAPDSHGERDEPGARPNA